MVLDKYPKKVVDAAIRAKEMSAADLARIVGRSTSSVYRAIKGTSRIRSMKLEEAIVKELQPELDLINEALNKRAG